MKISPIDPDRAYFNWLNLKKKTLIPTKYAEWAKKSTEIGNKITNINVTNCSLSTMSKATDKNCKLHLCIIFAVSDSTPLTLWIKYLLICTANTHIITV